MEQGSIHRLLQEIGRQLLATKPAVGYHENTTPSDNATVILQHQGVEYNRAVAGLYKILSGKFVLISAHEGAGPERYI
jgi:hypothetical protein